MLDASVSLNTPTPAASDVGFHRSGLKHGELWLHNYAAWLSPRRRVRPNSATLNAHAAGAGRGLVEHPLEPAAAITHRHHYNCGN